MYVGGRVAAIVGDMRSSVNRAASCSGGESVGAVVVIVGVILRSLIPFVGTPLVGVVNSGIIMGVESERAGSVKDQIRRVAELSELEIPRQQGFLVAFGKANLLKTNVNQSIGMK